MAVAEAWNLAVVEKKSVKSRVVIGSPEWSGVVRSCVLRQTTEHVKYASTQIEQMNKFIIMRGCEPYLYNKGRCS